MGYRYLYPVIDRAKKSLLNFLLRDEFTTAEAAPITSPRTCEPGPGTLDVNYTSGTVEISGGQAILTGVSSSYNDPSIWTSNAYDRETGLAFFLGRDYATSGIMAAWGLNITAQNPHTGVVRFNHSGGLLRPNGNPINTNSSSLPYDGAIVCRDEGYLLLADIGSGWEVKLWTNKGTSTPLYAGFGNYRDITIPLNYFNLVALPAPFDTNNGIYSDYIANASAGNTFTHAADFWVRFNSDSVPSTSTDTMFAFRMQDSSNHWRINITQYGHVQLYEVVAGVPTLRGEITWILWLNDDVSFCVNGSTITCLWDDDIQFSYTSATNFQTETAGEILQIGPSGGISDFAVIDYYLTGDAATALDAYTA